MFLKPAAATPCEPYSPFCKGALPAKTNLVHTGLLLPRWDGASVPVDKDGCNRGCGKGLVLGSPERCRVSYATVSLLGWQSQLFCWPCCLPVEPNPPHLPM